MKLLLFVLLILSASPILLSQWLMEPRDAYPGGAIQPYIPYYHICVLRCYPMYRFDVPINSNCCNNGWEKCCQLQIFEGMLNPAHQYPTPTQHQNPISSPISSPETGISSQTSDGSKDENNNLKLSSNHYPQPALRQYHYEDFISHGLQPNLNHDPNPHYGFLRLFASPSFSTHDNQFPFQNPNVYLKPQNVDSSQKIIPNDLKGKNSTPSAFITQSSSKQETCNSTIATTELIDSTQKEDATAITM